LAPTELVQRIHHGTRPLIPISPLLLTAVAAGGTVALHPGMALALVLGVTVLLIVVADIRALPLFLICTMFIESFEFASGLSVGRLAGAFALAAVTAYVLYSRRTQLRPSALLVAAALFGVWTFASVLWAGNPDDAYRDTFSYLIDVGYALAFALLVRGAAQLRAVFLTLVLGSALVGVLSFFHYVAGEASASGFQGDRNFFALYQVIAIPAALVLAAQSRSPARRLLYYAAISVIVLSVVASESRGGVITLGAATVITLFTPGKLFFRRLSHRLMYALAFLLAAAVTFAAGAQPFLERATTILDAADPTGYDRGSGRLDLWRAAITGFRESPWIGLGGGNFRARSLDLLQETPGVDLNQNYIKEGVEAHNSYLDVITGLGVVGGVLFAAVLALTLVSLVRSLRHARAAGALDIERYAAGVLAAMLALSVTAAFLSVAYGRLLWTLVGLTLALSVITRPRTSSFDATPAPPALASRRRPRLGTTRA
jgi:O-antigen ligase